MRGNGEFMNYSKKGVRAKQRALNSKSSKWGRKFVLTCVKLILAAIIGVGICGVSAGIGAFKGILSTTPNIHLSDVVASGEATIVYDNQGNEVDQYVSANSNRIHVTMDQVPKHLGQAFVAIEDERFYQHNGVDVKGMMRAAYQFIKTRGKEAQGASTITQQLLKNTVFTSWTSEGDNMIKKIKRKIQEQYLALEITKYYTKDEILLNYMNAINLGQNTLGVESASQRYFGKSCSELTLSECAVIACITQNPSYYNPIRYPEHNKERREKCLKKMLDLEFITQAEYDEAMADTDAVYERIGLYDTHLQESDSTSGSYFSDAVYEQVKEDLIAAGYNSTMAENLLTSGGLRIESTMDPTIQSILDEEFANADNYNPQTKWYLTYALTITDASKEKHNFSKENMMSWFKENGNRDFNLIFSSQDAAYEAIETYRSAMLAELGVEDNDSNYEESISMTAQPQVAMVVEDQSTGYVVALVGGRGTKEGRRTLNRATDALRSPGSTFKVLASFAPALDSAGKTLATVYNDAPFNYDDGTPVNNWYKTGYRGINSIREAIRSSLNIIAVKNQTVITPQLGYDYLLNFGFTTLTDGVMINGKNYTDVNQTLALGGLTYGVSPYELNAAYAAIANQGVYVQPKLYTRVTDSDGNVILDNTTPTSHRVIKETTAFLLTDAMVDVVTTGTGARVRFDTAMAIAGKTGTSTDTKDAWFAGYTPYYTATVWTGYDNSIGMSTSSSNDESAISKNIWKAVMKRIHENLPKAQFPTPTGIVQVEICTQSGKLPIPGLCDGNTRMEYFEEGTEPTESCDIHYQGDICAYDHLPASADCPFKYYGTGTFALAEEEALISGSTVITENEDGTQTVTTPVTRSRCQHDASFFANPDYESVLQQQQWEMNQNGTVYSYEDDNNDE
jgi:penicillin-binding protein 1A